MLVDSSTIKRYTTKTSFLSSSEACRTSVAQPGPVEKSVLKRGNERGSRLWCAFLLVTSPAFLCLGATSLCYTPSQYINPSLSSPDTSEARGKTQRRLRSRPEKSVIKPCERSRLWCDFHVDLPGLPRSWGLHSATHHLSINPSLLLLHIASGFCGLVPAQKSCWSLHALTLQAESG